MALVWGEQRPCIFALLSLLGFWERERERKRDVRRLSISSSPSPAPIWSEPRTATSQSFLHPIFGSDSAAYVPYHGAQHRRSHSTTIRYWVRSKRSICVRFSARPGPIYIVRWANDLALVVSRVVLSSRPRPSPSQEGLARTSGSAPRRRVPALRVRFDDAEPFDDPGGRSTL